MQSPQWVESLDSTIVSILSWRLVCEQGPIINRASHTFLRPREDLRRANGDLPEIWHQDPLRPLACSRFLMLPTFSGKGNASAEGLMTRACSQASSRQIKVLFQCYGFKELRCMLWFRDTTFSSASCCDLTCGIKLKLKTRHAFFISSSLLMLRTAVSFFTMHFENSESRLYLKQSLRSLTV